MNKPVFYIFSFYRFCKLKNKKKIKKNLENYFKNKVVKGTVLLANEGINASLSASKEDLDLIIKYIKRLLNIRKIDIKINKSHFLPFNRIKVRLKNEIVSMGIKDLDVENHKVFNILPEDWDNFIKNKDYMIIDVRNNYEIGIGKFSNSINPNTNSFREFPKKLEEMNIKKNNKLAIYCTGGIRCEKASAFLKLRGYKHIYQLKGGILNYLQFKKNKKENSHWSGECFVFDDRVTINSQLEKGKYLQCFGCRQPITKKDTINKRYIKGVCCPYCYNNRTESQKKRSASRQRQIEISKERGLPNIFIK